MTPADLAALIERLSQPVTDLYRAAQNAEAAIAALVQLREEISARSDLMQGYLDCWRNDKERAERAEAEVARLKARENDETMRVYGVSLQRALGRIAALEAERDAWKSKLLAEEVEHDATMAERDALHADAVAIFEWMNRKGGMGLDVHRRIDTFLATWSKP